MLYFNIILTVNDSSDVETVKGLLVEQRTHSLEEPGCARFEVYHSTVEPTKFMLVERWESQEAVDAHRKGYAYTNIYQPKVLPLVVREGHPSNLL